MKNWCMMQAGLMSIGQYLTIKKLKKYKGEIIAKLIVSEVKYTNIGIDGGKISDVVYEYLLEVMSDKVKIDRYREPCLPGYYRIRYFPRLDR